jgi:hypothetical protein
MSNSMLAKNPRVKSFKFRGKVPSMRRVISAPNLIIESIIFLAFDLVAFKAV